MRCAQRFATPYILARMGNPAAVSGFRIALCSVVLQTPSALAGSQRLHCMHLCDAGSTQQGCRQYDERLHVRSTMSV
jgi:hypothetical protein